MRHRVEVHQIEALNDTVDSVGDAESLVIGLRVIISHHGTNQRRGLIGNLVCDLKALLETFREVAPKIELCQAKRFRNLVSLAVELHEIEALDNAVHRVGDLEGRIVSITGRLVPSHRRAERRNLVSDLVGSIGENILDEVDNASFHAKHAADMLTGQASGSAVPRAFPSV